MTPISPMLKVCCIASIEEARMALSHGATAVGLVGEMPSGPGIIDDDTIRAIAADVGAAGWSVLLTSRVTAQGIVDHVRDTGVNTVQIVDAPEAGSYAALRAQLPHVRILQVIHVEDEDNIAEAVAAAAEVDAILLDSGKPKAAVKTLGGTGDRHDWSISRKIVEAVEVPVFLAGGIRPENVAEALREVQPAGIDLCTGIRDKNHALVEDRLKALITEMMAAEA
ncbi:MAG: phosphoribosylanthranilate isomerase [Rhodospirillaceae bacterium]